MLDKLLIVDSLLLDLWKRDVSFTLVTPNASLLFRFGSAGVAVANAFTRTPL
jgi:hypothetical protein